MYTRQDQALTDDDERSLWAQACSNVRELDAVDVPYMT